MLSQARNAPNAYNEIKLGINMEFDKYAQAHTVHIHQ